MQLFHRSALLFPRSVQGPRNNSHDLYLYSSGLPPVHFESVWNWNTRLTLVLCWPRPPACDPCAVSPWLWNLTSDPTQTQPRTVFLNLPNRLWGLLGPQRTKFVHIFVIGYGFVIWMTHWRLGSEKTPQPVKCWFFYHPLGRLNTVVSGPDHYFNI